MINPALLVIFIVVGLVFSAVLFMVSGAILSPQSSARVKTRDCIAPFVWGIALMFISTFNAFFFYRGNVGELKNLPDETYRVISQISVEDGGYLVILQNNKNYYYCIEQIEKLPEDAFFAMPVSGKLEPVMPYSASPKKPEKFTEE